MKADEREANMLDLEAIEARCNAATPPPWEPRPPTGKSVLWGVWKPGERGDNSEADSHFAAAAREDVPALIAEVRWLEAELVDSARRCEQIEDDVEAFIQAERQRCLDAVWAVGQTCTFEELGVCVRIQSRIEATEDPMDGTRSTDAAGNRL